MIYTTLHLRQSGPRSGSGRGVEDGSQELVRSPRGLGSFMPYGLVAIGLYIVMSSLSVSRKILFGLSESDYYAGAVRLADVAS